MQLVNLINAISRRVPAWPLYIVGFVPAVITFYLALTNQLGADPAKALEHELGEIALQLLVVTLAITPLRNLLKINFIKFRRAIGLLAFFYTALHLLTYLLLDQQLWWDAIIKDITKRPYIIIGVVSFFVMVPLAITSSNRMVRKLGPVAWRRLHKLTYVAAVAGGLHYVMLKKTWEVEPLLYLMIILVLVAYRFWKNRRLPMPA